MSNALTSSGYLEVADGDLNDAAFLMVEDILRAMGKKRQPELSELYHCARVICKDCALDIPTPDDFNAKVAR